MTPKEAALARLAVVAARRYRHDPTPGAKPTRGRAGHVHIIWHGEPVPSAVLVRWLHGGPP